MIVGQSCEVNEVAQMHVYVVAEDWQEGTAPMVQYRPKMLGALGVTVKIPR
jgi:hypothetical protein